MSTTTPTRSIRQAVALLVQRLQLPEQTTDVVIQLQADMAPRITITRLLTPEELEQLSAWYVVEGLERIPSGETTYDLEPRSREEGEVPIEQADPIDQVERQNRIEQLYLLSGRDDPSHPHHHTYTGLVAASEGEGEAAAA